MHAYVCQLLCLGFRRQPWLVSLFEFETVTGANWPSSPFLSN